MAAFVHSLQTDSEVALTTAQQALESHLMAFAAEKARLEGKIVKLDEV